MTTNIWNPTFYQSNHNFVWQYGESLLTFLKPQQGERILDLGCGTGQLTAKIAEMGAEVLGIDADRGMIAEAKANYPTLQFMVADARNFQVDTPYAAIFSNAALHWIKPPELAIQCMYRALQPGGRFVAEFGGRGNIQQIQAVLFSTLEAMGCEVNNPWYFPGVGEYTSLLEAAGFEVDYGELFDRTIVLPAGESGLANWLRMFGQGIFAALSPGQESYLIHTIEEKVRSILFRDQDALSQDHPDTSTPHWIADYRRLRVIAHKP
jgi:trans-aconitate methyltransferase